ncbi:MAG: hypothetical protein ACRDAT_01125, partial [Cetobacterium sp.]
MYKLDKRNKYLETETIDTGETYYLEEELFLDEKTIKNKSLIRVDMNIVQFPIFSKNTKKRKNEITTYFFNKNRDTHITVTPAAGEYIPGETEEIIFIALMSIMKRNGMKQEFHTTSSEIKAEAKINSKNYGSLIKSSLNRLSTTNYNFKNTMYSSENRGVLSEEISTPILTFKARSLLEKNYQHLRNEFNDKRIREAYWIKISDYFYDNMIKKGYLVYDSNLLLQIDSSVARTIYMLVEKLRFNETYLKIDTVFLIKRIPLKFEKKNIYQTLKTIENSLNILKEKKLIEKFEFVKESTWEKSEIEIYFPEFVVQDKQDRFFGDLNDFRNLTTKMLISGTEHEVINQEIQELKSKIDKDSVGEPLGIERDNNPINPQDILEMVEEIMKIIPSTQKLKTMPKAVYDSIVKYGFKEVKLAAIYLSKQKNLKSPRMYFLKILENNWQQDLEYQLKVSKKNSSECQMTFEETILDSKKDSEKKQRYYDDIFDEFLKLDEKVQNGIESYAYKEYIELCGAEGKVQRLAFIAGRKAIISEFLIKYETFKKVEPVEVIEVVEPIKVVEPVKIEPYDPKKETNPEILKKAEEFKKTIENDIYTLNNKINETIDVYKIVLGLSNEKVFE